jgi:hypothetical protein
MFFVRNSSSWISINHGHTVLQRELKFARVQNLVRLFLEPGSIQLAVSTPRLALVNLNLKSFKWRIKKEKMV